MALCTRAATTLDSLGVLFLRLQKAPGAEAFFRRALAVRESKLGETSQAALESLHHLSQALRLQGRYTEAERLLVRELSILEANQGKRTPHHGHVLAELATIQFRQNRFESGERYLNEISGFAAELPVAQREEVAEMFRAYAQLLRSAKRKREAGLLDEKIRGFVGH